MSSMEGKWMPSQFAPLERSQRNEPKRYSSVDFKPRRLRKPCSSISASGSIRDNKIMFTIDRATGKKRGFCFIEFNDESTVDVIVSQQYHTVAGRQLETKRAQEKGKAPPRAATAATPATAYPQTSALAGLYPGLSSSSAYQQPIIYVSPESLP